MSCTPREAPMPDAPAAHVGSAFPLLSCFFEFWEEVEDLRRQVQSPDEAADTFPAAAGGRERLAEALRSQRLSLAHPQATASQLQLEETQYVMAATADELF